mgnify:CR=1 FL=1
MVKYSQITDDGYLKITSDDHFKKKDKSKIFVNGRHLSL